jgi:hypothetical protein
MVVAVCQPSEGGVGHCNRFPNFVIGVELCPPNYGKFGENGTIFWDAT